MHRLQLLSIITLTLAIGGCDTAQDAPSPEAAPKTSATTSALPPDHPPIGGASPQISAPTNAPGLSWTTPEGWTERPSSGMRVADFQLPGDESAECYVTQLGGTGGGLEANLNRWRDQVGLAPYGPGEVDALERIDVLGTKAVYAEMEGSYAGMSEGEGKAGFTLLGVVAEKSGSSVFIKLTAPSAIAEAERENFKEFCKSLNESGTGASMPPLTLGGGLPSGHPPVAPQTNTTPPPAPSMDEELTWVTPEGWTRGSERPMRMVTYHPKGNEDAECYIITLAGEAGGLAANVNRWLVQIGEDALDETAIAALPTVTMMGQPATLVEAEGNFRGMDGASREGYRLLGAIRESSDQSIFVKFTGPSDLVEAEKDAFIAFCESIE